MITAATRRTSGRVLVLLLCSSAGLLGAGLPATHAGTGPPATPGTTQLISVSTMGRQANCDSYGDVAVSSGGRFIAFNTCASNWAPDSQVNGRDDFVRDRLRGKTTMVSVADQGTPGHGDNYLCGMSGGGRYVAFTSNADDLVTGDNNGRQDAFVRDRVGRATVRVSLTEAGHEFRSETACHAMSNNGRFIVFVRIAPDFSKYDLLLRDVRLGRTEHLSTDGTGQGVSRDGRYVMFFEDTTYVLDRLTGARSRVDATRHGQVGKERAFGSDLSSDGRFAVFVSSATDLVPGDTNGVEDVFVRHLPSGRIERVSVPDAGGNAASRSGPGSISADGRYVAFTSLAENLVAGDTNGRPDVFVRDRWLQTTARLSVPADGGQAGGGAFLELRPAMSANGRHVAFVSAASDLVTADTNDTSDVFLRTRGEHW